MPARTGRTLVMGGFLGAMGLAGAIRTVAIGGRFSVALSQLGVGLVCTGFAAAWIVQYGNRSGRRSGTGPRSGPPFRRVDEAHRHVRRGSVDERAGG